MEEEGAGLHDALKGAAASLEREGIVAPESIGPAPRPASTQDQAWPWDAGAKDGPATEEAAYVMNRMREHGILLGIDGPYHNVLKIRPPMPFDERNGDYLAARLEEIFQENFI